MATSDLNMLLDMGFEKERAELAVKKTGNLQGAIDWLDKNQEKSLEEIKAAETTSIATSDEPPALNPGEEARSLVCNECGKKFRSTAQAEFHATKTEHTDFSESTEEIKPLTEEEKKAKLEELREKAAAKRTVKSEQDKLDRKKNEEIRRKATKESHDIREDLQKKEQLKEAAAKKREKQAELDAKKRVLAKLEADKAERRRKAELEKAQRTGQTLPPPEALPPSAAAAAAAAPPAQAAKPSSAYSEARLRLQMPGGTLMKTFPAEATLFEVAHKVAEESGVQVQSFTQNFPRKVFEGTDFGMTLKEAGMVPSAALIVR